MAERAIVLGVCAVAVASAVAQSELPTADRPSGQSAAGELGLPRVFNTPNLMDSVPPDRLAQYLLNWGRRSEEILVVLGRELALLGPGTPVGEYLVATAESAAGP